MGTTVSLIEHSISAAAFPHGKVEKVEVADLLVAYLEQIGVEYVFGIPGGAIEPLYNALARSERRGGIRHVLARHECGAAFMADGYARESGMIGVCCATSGPGSTNLITGVACAQDNHIPLLAISGLPAMPSFGKGALQESSSLGVNSVAMFDHCTRYNAMVTHPSQFERKLINALMAAKQGPGAAHLAVPLDILRSPAQHAHPSYDLATLLNSPARLIDEQAVASLLRELRAARRIVFLIGTGCDEAIETVMQLAGLLHAQFITTPDAKGLINPHHPAYCGVFGFGGHASAHHLLNSNPDLILAFGTGFSEFISGGWCSSLLNGRLVHIDSNEDNLMRSPMARLHIRGHIQAICARLAQSLNDSISPGDAQAVFARPRKNGVIFDAPESYDSDAAPVKPQRLMKTLSERCPSNTRFLADMGNSMVWTTHYLQGQDRRIGSAHSDYLTQKPDRRAVKAGWLRVIMNFCPMGWSLGAAVGVARGNPSNPVVCITGDGAYLMSGQEITVAEEENLPVVFVVLNDGALGMVKHGQRLARAEATAHRLPKVDFAKQAEALGIPGHTVRTPQELDALDFEALLQRKGPTLIDVHIDGEEVPPMILRMKTLGTVK